MPAIYFLSMSNILGGAERVGLQIADVLTRHYRCRSLLNSALKSHCQLPEPSVSWMHVPTAMVRIARNPLGIFYYLFASLWFVFRHCHGRGTVYYCNDIESVFLAAPAKLLYRGKIVWHMHDIYKLEKRSNRIVLGILAQFTDVVVCLTGRNALRMSNLFKCRIEVVPNFCRLAPLRGERERGFRQDGEVVLGYLGQITRWKRVDIAIRLVQALNEEYGIKARLRIGGTPLYESDQPYQKELSELSGGASYIEWLGPVSDPVHFFSGLDFLLSLSDNEPFGLVILEALSQGVPVISSEGDGPLELLEGGIGLLVTQSKENLPMHVANFVETLCDEDYRAISIACINRASKLYSAQSFSHRICRIIQNF